MNNVRENYSRLKDTYQDTEKFLVSYAVRGPILVPGTRQGLPVLHPISGPVHEPSPLNTRWRFDPPGSPVGVL